MTMKEMMVNKTGVAGAPGYSIEADVSDIRQAFEIILEPDAVAELRVLGTNQGTVSGYFDTLDPMAREAKQWSGKAPAVYMTLNPVNPALLSRAVNRTQKYAKVTTSDNDILYRRWLGIDLDPVRPSGIPSTDEEHQYALLRLDQIRDHLSAQGWPQPISADSGNGGHLLYRVDLPNDEASRILLERCLKALDFHFSDERVVVDLKTANAARIWKTYGTLACKGDHTASRPHRIARLLEIPEQTSVVSRELLEQLAGSAPEDPKPEYASDVHTAFDLERWIAIHELPVATSGSWNDGRKFVLNPCPFNPDHTNQAAYIVQFPSGAIEAGCHHNGCAGKDWSTLRAMKEPGWRERRENKSGASAQIQPTQDPLASLLTPTAQIARLSVKPPPGLPTGFRTLDDVLGGLGPERFVTVAGRPGAGKTSWQLNVAEYLGDQGIPVLFVSAEMSFTDIGRRRVAIRSGTPLNAIPNPPAPDMLEGLADVPVYVVDVSSPTLLELEALVEAAQRAYGIEVVFVDHLGKLRTGTRQLNRYVEVGEITRTLKDMAKRRGIPVVAACQLNRAIESGMKDDGDTRRPTLADLRDSGNIEEEADQVVFIWGGKRKEIRREQILSVEKNRHGEQKDIRIVFDRARQRIRELPRHGGPPSDALD